jgi:hypothetical protein
MCPSCITSMAVTLVGVASTGGCTAIFVKMIGVKNQTIKREKSTDLYEVTEIRKSVLIQGEKD